MLIFCQEYIINLLQIASQFGAYRLAPRHQAITRTNIDIQHYVRMNDHLTSTLIAKSNGRFIWTQKWVWDTNMIINWSMHSLFILMFVPYI